MRQQQNNHKIKRIIWTPGALKELNGNVYKNLTSKPTTKKIHGN